MNCSKYHRAACGILFTTFLSLNACNTIDNQLTMKPEHHLISDPAPTSRNFLALNQTHRVLMAVVDTGVDYNHPELLPNIHFELNSSGTPISAGFDFISNDVWPAPYVIRTSAYDYNASFEIWWESERAHADIETLLRKAPDLSAIAHPDRHLYQEFEEGTYHGTHVAGLMVYDRPDFGLISYRVLPQNKYPSSKENYESLAEAADMIAKSVERAAAANAKVVNMSLGVEFQKATPEEDTKDSAETYKKHMKYKQIVADAILAHPEITFVVAAGNDGRWRDGDNQDGFPCGIASGNVLCVGALRENGDITEFSNIALKGTAIVFALGKNVISTLPYNMCVNKEAIHSIEYLSSKYNHRKDFDGTIEEVRKKCLTPNRGYGPLSGTSMASPLVAHLAAEIIADNPLLSGAEVIREIKRRAIPSFIGALPAFKIRIKKPSWYARFEPTQPPSLLSQLIDFVSPLNTETESDQYFEGTLIEQSSH